MITENNPPAFPGKREGVNNEPDIVFNQGMTLRDYFATRIISAMVYHHYNGANHKNRAREWAEASYEISDAMLAERNRKNE